MTDTGRLVNDALKTAYDIARDGRYLGLISFRDDYQIVVVPNWRAELDKRIAAAEKK